MSAANRHPWDVICEDSVLRAINWKKHAAWTCSRKQSMWRRYAACTTKRRTSSPCGADRTEAHLFYENKGFNGGSKKAFDMRLEENDLKQNKQDYLGKNYDE